MPMFKREQEIKTISQYPAPLGATNAPPPRDDFPASAPTPVTQPAEAEPLRATSPLNREAAAVIDKKTEIKGTLHSQGNVLIEGCFNGEIEAKETIWIEKGANTQGKLHANDAVVSGAFDGEILCGHRLQIAATATVSGEINTPVLVIEEGATINCRFSMKPARR